MSLDFVRRLQKETWWYAVQQIFIVGVDGFETGLKINIKKKY